MGLKTRSVVAQGGTTLRVVLKTYDAPHRATLFHEAGHPE